MRSPNWWRRLRLIIAYSGRQKITRPMIFEAEYCRDRRQWRDDSARPVRRIRRDVSNRWDD